MLQVMVDINDFKSWAQGCRYYEHLRVVVDMDNSGSWAQVSKYYE